LIWILVVLTVYLLGLVLIMMASIKPLRTPAISSPGAMGSPQESVMIPSADGLQLRGWWIEGTNPNAVVVLAHGYFMSMGELAPVAYWLWQRGVSCLLFDFRAHGQTRGGKSTFGYKERLDVAAAVRYAKQRKPGAKVVAIGSSMGSVASALAWAEDPTLLDGLVLDSAYGRLSRAILGWWKFLGGNWLAVLLSPSVVIGGPLAGVNPAKVDVAKALRKIGKPVLVMHGDRDRLADVKEARRNIEALGPNAEVVWFEGCGHSEGRWEQPEKYQRCLQAYLERIGVLETISATKTL